MAPGLGISNPLLNSEIPDFTPLVAQKTTPLPEIRTGAARQDSTDWPQGAAHAKTKGILAPT